MCRFGGPPRIPQGRCHVLFTSSVRHNTPLRKPGEIPTFQFTVRHPWRPLTASALLAFTFKLRQFVSQPSQLDPDSELGAGAIQQRDEGGGMPAVRIRRRSVAARDFDLSAPFGEDLVFQIVLRHGYAARDEARNTPTSGLEQ